MELAPLAVAPRASRRLRVEGRVQGVGFRPFVFRLARRLGITGYVRNQHGQVEILAQGEPDALAEFERALVREAPPLARPALALAETTDEPAFDTFYIARSERAAESRVHVPPDYFACEACLAELRAARDRRHRYPFINCTQCGPRYTLITRLPYDRANTTMDAFPLCAACRAEYEDVADRRFHAEPIACPTCGPQLRFRDRGRRVDGNEAALWAAVAALRAGDIVAVKGIGGYHLMCDARNDVAIARLRAAKPRPHKPLAVMFAQQGPDGLAAVREATRLAPAHVDALRDPMRPIVLVPKRAGALSDLIAPGLGEIGVMLPYSPLHHLLLEDFGGPLVATSGNVSGEPVLTDNAEADGRLGHVAVGFLHHDRPIARPADDSVFRMIAGRARPLRLGRGAAPLELDLPFTLARPTLAVGGHMKSTIALGWADRVVVSPHIGDLGTPRSLAVFEQIIGDLQNLYGVRAERVACDAHPGYASTRFALRSGLPATRVYHHRAHASALAGEHADVARWLTFTWDGVGYGEDGTLWGGEALLGRPGDWQRVASQRPFRLPGGERAGREPWRSAAALCWETGRPWGADANGLLRRAWEQGVNAPVTTAVGRLFDAAAALTGLLNEASFEGQGPMYLEAACAQDSDPIALPLAQDTQGVWRSDWSPLLPMLLDDSRSVAERATRFHASLAHALLAQARVARVRHGDFTVGLTGGVFQNRVLTEMAVGLLGNDGFDVRLAEQVPCNDAGISFGQIIESHFYGFEG